MCDINLWLMWVEEENLFFSSLRRSFLSPAKRCGQDGPHGCAKRQRDGPQLSESLPHVSRDGAPVLGAHPAHLHRDPFNGPHAEQVH